MSDHDCKIDLQSCFSARPKKESLLSGTLAKLFKLPPKKTQSDYPSPQPETTFSKNASTGLTLLPNSSEGGPLSTLLEVPLAADENRKGNISCGNLTLKDDKNYPLQGKCILKEKRLASEWSRTFVSACC